MTYTNHSSVTLIDKDTDECEYLATGAFTNATSDLHSVSLHDVTDIKRKTRTVNGQKVTDIIFTGEDGNTFVVTAFREWTA